MKKDICLAYWRWALAQLATAKYILRPLVRRNRISVA